ncbi:MAG: LysM domain-containing protein [Lachnospiraceae bacterium]
MEETVYRKEDTELEELPEEASMDQVVYHFREIMKQKKQLAGQKRVTGLLCAVSMVLFILSVAISVATMNSYEKMKQMETALQAISEGMERTLAQSTPATEPLPEAAVEETAVAAAVEEPSLEAPALEEKEEQVVYIVEDQQTDSYIVQEGDTLAKISRMFYQTDNRVDEICELNDINDKDKILCGQELQLP